MIEARPYRVLTATCQQEVPPADEGIANRFRSPPEVIQQELEARNHINLLLYALARELRIAAAITECERALKHGL